MLALGKKRSRKPTFRRTTSMSGITIDVGNLEEEEEEAAPPTPIGGEFEHLLSPGYLRKTYSGGFHTETAGFLRICCLCNCRLIPGRDIYMYRGDTAFCSLECREQQIEQDERNERLAAAKSGESHHPELPTTTPEPETVAVT